MGGDELGDSGTMELTRNIMIVSIIALSMAMIFVFFLHLYSKWYWYRRRQGMVMEDPNNRGCEQRGLDASFLKTIRVIQFDPKDFKEGLECAVCLSEVEEGEKARILPKCDHGFHVECIDMWFHTHSTCPICRNPVTDQTEISLEQEESTTNDLFRGDEANNHHQIQTPALPSEQASASSSSLQTYKNRGRPDLVIDIPRQANEEEEEVSCSGMRSLKRILSVGSTRFNPFSPAPAAGGTGTGSSSSNVKSCPP